LGKEKMTLEVVDTNPEAKKLYERKGFVVTKIENIAFLTIRAGFRKVIHMRKVIV
jgi:ribosomal protein S18 acetylase RimI-like enzyme